MNKAQLQELLSAQHVPYFKWGTGESKTLDHLLTEIKSEVITKVLR